ncbi:glycine zipper 2TM domain-containing protein [Phenylobacterium sp.]|uniref:glycine zipper 2TM domain-containing protein n=1 Tax=Phenylobacterium sp. TaxID=1871053 RepID=UPI003562D714
MRNLLALTALAAGISLPLIAAPMSASASCESRKNTGTLVGGVAGALVGNSISHRGAGGAIIGGLGGAVIGHEIAKSGCGTYRHASRRGRGAPPQQAAAPAGRMYYDQYGNAVVSPAPADYRR